jgi:hypothetical protein
VQAWRNNSLGEEGWEAVDEADSGDHLVRGGTTQWAVASAEVGCGAP